LTAEQRLKTRTDPLEKEAADALRIGPAEKAVELYERLLDLKPGHEPYADALKTAKAYVAAAERTTETWRPGTPYIGLKGRYSHLLACTSCDTKHLEEVLKLQGDLVKLAGVRMIRSERGPDWEDAKLKYLRLYEHVIDHYPANESQVLDAKVESGMLRRVLYKDTQTFLQRAIDVFSLREEEIVNVCGGLNAFPMMIEGRTEMVTRQYMRKKQYRQSVINACMSDPRWYNLLDTIITRCADSDPEIVEMAKAAKAQIAASQRPGKDEGAVVHWRTERISSILIAI